MRITNQIDCIDPCHVYNTSSGVFDRLCDGVCSYDDSGKVRCCDEIQCDHDDRGLVCGNDGNNYESECAMKKLVRLVRDVASKEFLERNFF